MSSITPVKFAVCMLRVGYQRISVVVWRGGNCFCTPGLEASTLGFTVWLGASDPGLFRDAVCWKICAKMCSASSCRLPTFSNGVLGLGSDRAVTSYWAEVVSESMTAMLGTLVCCRKNSTVSDLRSALVLVTYTK